jgi:CRISPR-associated protein Cas2
MRHWYIVCYDIRDPDRLRRVHDKMEGFGAPLQYSVFACDLTLQEKMVMVAALSGLINHREDRIMIVDTGPVEGRGKQAVEFLGQVPPDLGERRPVIV